MQHATPVELFLYFLRTLLLGTGATLMLTFASLLLALILGFVLALMRLSRRAPLAALARIYLEIIRNTPVLTQLFILYFGLARLGLALPATVAATLGFGLNGAALLCEVFRASIRSVNPGQREAALAIGMTPGRAMRLIVLPQAVRTALPPTGNFAIGLLKDTSLASAVAVPELAMRAKMLVAETYLSSEIYLMVAAIYLCLSLAVARLVAVAEKRARRQWSSA